MVDGITVRRAHREVGPKLRGENWGLSSAARGAGARWTFSEPATTEPAARGALAEARPDDLSRGRRRPAKTEPMAVPVEVVRHGRDVAAAASLLSAGLWLFALLAALRALSRREASRAAEATVRRAHADHRQEALRKVGEALGGTASTSLTSLSA